MSYSAVLGDISIFGLIYLINSWILAVALTNRIIFLFIFEIGDVLICTAETVVPRRLIAGFGSARFAHHIRLVTRITRQSCVIYNRTSHVVLRCIASSVSYFVLAGEVSGRGTVDSIDCRSSGCTDITLVGTIIAILVRHVCRDVCGSIARAPVLGSTFSNRNRFSTGCRFGDYSFASIRKFHNTNVPTLTAKFPGKVTRDFTIRLSASLDRVSTSGRRVMNTVGENQNLLVRLCSGLSGVGEEKLQGTD